MLLVICHGPGAAARGELAQLICAEQRAEAQVDKLGESELGRRALFALDVHAPLLCGIGEVEGGEPDLLFFHRVLVAEVLLTSVEEG